MLYWKKCLKFYFKLVSMVSMRYLKKLIFSVLLAKLVLFLRTLYKIIIKTHFLFTIFVCRHLKFNLKSLNKFKISYKVSGYLLVRSNKWTLYYIMPSSKIDIFPSHVRRTAFIWIYLAWRLLFCLRVSFSCFTKVSVNIIQIFSQWSYRYGSFG